MTKLKPDPVGAPLHGMTSESRTSHFLTNVLWSWSGVAVNLFTGFFLSPFLIRRLGDDNFGTWTLVLVLVENYWLLDFGFRNATLKYTAHYRALNEPVNVNRVINTAVLYSSVIALLTLAVTLFGRSFLAGMFHSTNPVFGTLLLIVGISWSVGIVFNVFNVALEGFQRFDITSRLWIISSFLRASLTLAVVLAGFGLREMGLVLLASQVFIYASSFLYFSRIFPQFKLSPALANRAVLKEMGAFASHNFAISISLRILTQSPPLLIGTRLPPRFVAYFSVPQKLLDYPADAVGRVGNVSGSTSAELYARGAWPQIASLGVWTNRYCAALYFFLVVYLSVYGLPFLSVWLTPEFAAKSAGLLPFLLLGTAAVSSQYNSATILVHIGGQKAYARAVMVEAACLAALILPALSRFGLPGAAALMGGLAVLNRGVVVSWMLSRRIAIPYPSFVWRIYAVPTAIAVLVALLLLAVRTLWLPGRDWSELGLAAALGGLVYYSLAFTFVLSPDHRRRALNMVSGTMSRFFGRATRTA